MSATASQMNCIRRFVQQLVKTNIQEGDTFKLVYTDPPWVESTGNR